MFLGAVSVVWLAGVPTLPLYVVPFAASSLRHAWGSAGQYARLAELPPDEQRLAAKTLVGSLTFAGTIAGVLVTQVSAAYVLGLDALSYLFLPPARASTATGGVFRWTSRRCQVSRQATLGRRRDGRSSAR